ncbi:telomere stability and silencing-domain-containing protein [Armillaria mellea]|nr:telomere stability and silencing-domain-containing protein [Armillaria mellea]
MTANILVSAFTPFHSLSLSAIIDACLINFALALEERYPLLPVDSLHLSTHSGAALLDDAPISTLLNDSDLLTLHLTPRLLSGKGGFGSQLRAAGGSKYLEAEPERVAAKVEAQKAKLEALKHKLGIEPRKGSSSRTSTPGQSEPAPVVGKKHQFEDMEYLKQSKELVDVRIVGPFSNELIYYEIPSEISQHLAHLTVDGVKNAVSAALLKKKKKAKLTHDMSATDKTARAPAAATVPASAASNVEADGA